MFDKTGFKSIMSPGTGNIYCNGLNHIEAMFGVSIDDEFEKDHCDALMSHMKRVRDEVKDSPKEWRELGCNITRLKKYILFKQGHIHPTYEEPVCFEEVLDFIISEYKKEIPETMDKERYKWEAIAWFQEHWDPDAENFLGMLTEAFSKASVLLGSSMYYPLRMVQEYAGDDPETVRGLFKMLYDESIPLKIRYTDFRAAFQKRVDYLKTERKKSLQHYQDLRAIMVYLTFRYPDKYYFYKAKMFSIFKERTGYVETKYEGKSIVDKISSFNHMCELILERIKKDSELIEMNNAQLHEGCYNDEALHILTMNIVFYAVYYMDEDRFFKDKKEQRMEVIPVEEHTKTDIGLNTILYGPPGTGKTYQTVLYAVAIIENQPLESVKREKYAEVLARYQQYKKQKQIAFTTFHQSFSYEEFIEGICPVPPEENTLEEENTVQYKVQSGIFKDFCARAETPVLSRGENSSLEFDASTASVWKVSLGGTGENPVRTECLEHDHIRIGWDGYGPDITDETDFSANGGRVVLNTFINRMQVGDIVLSCYSASTIDAIGVITGEYEWHDEFPEMKRLRKVKWIVKNIRENILEINKGVTMTLSSVYRLSNITPEDVANILGKYQSHAIMPPKEKKRFVFIIDEINRGNISKIFGELITLIEPAKRTGRPEGIRAVLPYSRSLFGVPDNVYLIGTMNTADRSIAALDTALRRRFQFREMLPDPKILTNVMVEDVSISDLLTRMNQRIAVLYDREHTIGHAYFMPLVADPTVEMLGAIFENNIIPLLQEYFYDDYGKIRLILGDNQKQETETQFILRNEYDYADLFGNTDEEFDFDGGYEINHAAFGNIDAYRSI